MKTESDMACTPEQVDEAAVWMTLLHSRDRTQRTDSGFKRWLASHPSNAIAFEKVSVAHELTASMPLKPLPPPNLLRGDDDASWKVEHRPLRTRWPHNWAVAGAAVLVSIFGGIFFYDSSNRIDTAVGEQRTLALPDGSQVTLNTDTQIVVLYDERRRAVELKKGEAVFDVAKGAPERPFVVKAGGRTVTALGTTFNIRRDDTQLSVTLIEGKVAVSGSGASTSSSSTGQVLLVPGQRLTLAVHSGPRVDTPQLSKVVAWRAGRVEFDKVPLSEAIAEMNRYNTIKLAYELPEAAKIPITGVFRANSARSFAAAVAAAYGLQVQETDGHILLAGDLVPTAMPLQ